MQRGYIDKREYKGEPWWAVRWRETSLDKDGDPVISRRIHYLAPVRECPRKLDVERLRDEFFTEIGLNSGGGPEAQARSTMLIGAFYEQIYLPHAEKELAPSTLNGYKQHWTGYLQERLSSRRLREFRAPDGKKILESVLRDHDLNTNTLKHIKFTMSAIFRHACELGVLEHNPIEHVKLPRNVREPEDTYAHTLDEIKKHLAVLPEPARSAVAIASFAGLRRGEVRACRWEHYNGKLLWVKESAWGSHIKAPKSKASRAPVPVIRQLAAILNVRKLEQGWMFPALNTRKKSTAPLNLEHLAAQVIKPTLIAHDLEWHGWHAYRRGLATNLHELGVDDKTIQAILRHAKVETTRNIYIKQRQERTAEVMREVMEEALDSEGRVN